MWTRIIRSPGFGNPSFERRDHPFLEYSNPLRGTAFKNFPAGRNGRAPLKVICKPRTKGLLHIIFGNVVERETKINVGPCNVSSMTSVER